MKILPLLTLISAGINYVTSSDNQQGSGFHAQSAISINDAYSAHTAIEYAPISLEGLSTLNVCPMLDSLLRSQLDCVNSEPTPVSISFMDKVMNVIQDPRRVIYKDDDFVVYHSKQGNDKRTFFDSSATVIDKKFYLSQYNGFSIYSYDANKNRQFIKAYDDTDLVCRHLALEWLKRHETYHDDFSSEASIRNIEALMNNQVDKENTTYKADAYYFFSDGLFGKSLSTVCNQMQLHEIKTLVLMTGGLSNHMMGLIVKRKETGFVIKFFDPNAPTAHRRILCKNVEAMEKLDIEHMIGDRFAKHYFNTGPNGSILVYGNVHNVKSYAAHQKIDLSSWQDPVNSPECLDPIFRNVFLAKIKSLKSEMGSYESISNWLHSYFNANLPENQKIASLKNYIGRLKYHGLAIENSQDPNDMILTPAEHAALLKALLKPFLDAPLSIEQKLKILDESLINTKYRDPFLDEAITVWSEAIGDSILPEAQKQQLLEYIANSDSKNYLEKIKMRVARIFNKIM